MAHRHAQAPADVPARPAAVALTAGRRRPTAGPGTAGPDASALLAVLDGMDTAVLAVQAGSPTVLANAAARALFGLPTHRPVRVDELTDRVLVVGLHDGVPLGVDDLPVIRALSGAEVGGEVRVLPRDGAAGDPLGRDGRRLLLRARPLLDPAGQVVGAVCTAQDLTDLHTRHAVLTRHARELAAVNEATRAILTHEEARRAVCEAAHSVTRAAFAALFEPDGQGDLVCTVHAGLDLPAMRVAIGGTSPEADVFAGHAVRVGHAVQVGSAGVQVGPAGVPLPGGGRRAAVRAAGAEAPLERLGRFAGVRLRVGIWQPVVSRGRCLAVLVLGFADDAPVQEHLPVLEALAAEAALAVERQELLRRLRLEASSDGLTGAANRRAWDVELPRALATARLTGADVSLVMLDVDRFKEYNDTHGHPAGDALLRDVVTAWQRRLRAGDLLFRYGGEEFAVLLPGCGAAEALAVAEQLRAVVPRRQTCSAGVGTWDRQEPPEQLVQRVDDALYRAKAMGRDRAVPGD